MRPRVKLIALALYTLMVSAVVLGMFVARETTLRTLGTPGALDEWRQWREEAARQSATGPVRRKVPRTEAPPALILMRDHFPALLIGSVFFSSVLFVLTAWTLHGAFAKKAPHSDGRNAKPPG